MSCACIVSQGTPACLAALATRSSMLALCFLIRSVYLAKASATIMTVTLAPTNFASDNPCVTARSANSDPSVGIRICLYMLHHSLGELMIPRRTAYEEACLDMDQQDVAAV